MNAHAVDLRHPDRPSRLVMRLSPPRAVCRLARKTTTTTAVRGALLHVDGRKHQQLQRCWAHGFILMVGVQVLQSKATDALLHSRVYTPDPAPVSLHALSERHAVVDLKQTGVTETKSGGVRCLS